MKYIAMAALLGLSLNVHAGYQEEIDAFFTLFEQGKMEQAVDGIYATNSYVIAIPDQVKSIKSQLLSLGDLMGKYHQSIKIDEYLLKDSFVQVSYMVIYERQPLRFEFQFFRAGDTWKIYSFSYDDDIDEEIKGAARRRAISVD